MPGETIGRGTMTRVEHWNFSLAESMRQPASVVVNLELFATHERFVFDHGNLRSYVRGFRLPHATFYSWPPKEMQ